MHEYGADLREWLTPARVVALLDLIDQCPSACRWREAMALDEDLADQLVDQEDDEAPKWAPRVSEYNLTALLLREAVGLLGVIAQGKQLRKYTDPPPPRTALEAARARRAERGADALIALIAPHVLESSD